MSNDAFAQTYDRMANYPFVNPEMFTHSRRVDLTNGTVDILTDGISIDVSSTDQMLSNAKIAVPGYNLRFHDGSTMSDLFAVIAIGSNSSHLVLEEKFSKAGIGGTFVTLQSSIPYAVTHGAFVGARGTIPATVLPDGETSTQITISLLTRDQAEALTGTEPNYDLALADRVLITRGIANDPVLRAGAMLYVSPWGSLSTDGKTPLVQDAIPSETSLSKLSSAEAGRVVAGLLGAIGPVHDFFNDLNLDVRNRVVMNQRLAQTAIPAHFDGVQVKSSTIATAAAEHGFAEPKVIYRTGWKRDLA